MVGTRPARVGRLQILYDVWQWLTSTYRTCLNLLLGHYSSSLHSDQVGYAGMPDQWMQKLTFIDALQGCVSACTAICTVDHDRDSNHWFRYSRSHRFRHCNLYSHQSEGAIVGRRAHHSMWFLCNSVDREIGYQSLRGRVWRLDRRHGCLLWVHVFLGWGAHHRSPQRYQSHVNPALLFKPIGELLLAEMQS